MCMSWPTRGGASSSVGSKDGSRGNGYGQQGMEDGGTLSKYVAKIWCLMWGVCSSEIPQGVWVILRFKNFSVVPCLIKHLF